jgi:hypothetical protein
MDNSHAFFTNSHLAHPKSISHNDSYKVTRFNKTKFFNFADHEQTNQEIFFQL